MQVTKESFLAKRTHPIRILIGLILTYGIGHGVLAAAPTGDRMLFEINYDNWSMNPNQAEGNPGCLNVEDTDLQLRMHPGINGKGGGLLLSNSEQCRFDLRKNFHPAQGTVSLWVSPGNWKPSDDRYQHFFEARTKDYRFLIEKKDWPYLVLYLKYPDAPGTKKTFTCKIRLEDEDWAPGRWHKIDAVWDRKGMKLYLDGKLPPKRYYRVTKQAPTIPSVAFAPEFSLPEGGGVVALGSARGNDKMDEQHQTAYDEIRVYNYPLSAAQIKAAYEVHVPSTFGQKQQPQRITVPLAGRAVTIDGNLGEAEWADATRVPVASMGRNPRPAKAWAYFKHDTAGVHLAVSTDQAPGKRQWNEADGNIWEDDACELFLTDGTNAYHFIVNANGALYDEKGVDKTWNSAATVATTDTDSGWTMEMNLPAAALGGPAALRTRQWRGNIYFSYWDGITLTTSGWARPRGFYKNPQAFGDMLFSDGPETVRIESLGQLDNAGKLNLRVQTLPETVASGLEVIG